MAHLGGFETMRWWSSGPSLNKCRSKIKQRPRNEEREGTISIGNFLGLIGMPRPTQTRRLGSGYRTAVSWMDSCCRPRRSCRYLRPKDAAEVEVQDYESRMICEEFGHTPSWLKKQNNYFSYIIVSWRLSNYLNKSEKYIFQSK